jgi:hypothetical protein
MQMVLKIQKKNVLLCTIFLGSLTKKRLILQASYSSPFEIFSLIYCIIGALDDDERALALSLFGKPLTDRGDNPSTSGNGGKKSELLIPHLLLQYYLSVMKENNVYDEGKLKRDLYIID